jgi:hypothetical protein
MYQWLRVVGFLIGCTVVGNAAAGSLWTSMTPEEFAAKAGAMVNEQVEVGGTYKHPGFLGPDSIGVFVDPGTGKVLVQLLAPPTAQDVLGFAVARGDCAAKPCPGIYARGKIVMAKGQPALSLTEMSFDSQVKAQAGLESILKTVADKDRAGMNKPLLPPGGVPSKPAWDGWTRRTAAQPPTSNQAGGVWGQMTAQADRQRQRDSNIATTQFQGPDRPADFRTPYRGALDTGLAGFFKNYPYQGSGDEFPRVALVIEEKPAAGYLPPELYKGGAATKDYCWRLRAKLWVDATHPVDIAPFNWCFSETRFNVSYSPIPLWGQKPSAIVTLSAKFTPKQRTLGPVVPYTPLPETPEYRHATYCVPLMIGNVLMDIGFDNWLRSDGRVWFLEEVSR